MGDDLLAQIRENGAVPRHVAIIMDGNGRWARERSLPRPLGHRAGMKAVREAVEGAIAAGVEVLTLFAFSDENWQRPVTEISALMERLEDIDEEAVREKLYTAPWTDPDLLIRTSGELRLSNFLLWQLAYTELYMTPVLWPDVTRRELFQAILDYQGRERRFGRVSAPR